MNITVMKFGGSSLKDAARIENVASIVFKEKNIRCVVLSAMGGVTNLLIEAAKLSASGKDFEKVYEEIEKRHVDVVKELFSENDKERLIHEVEILCRELREFLVGVSMIRECSPRTLDLLTGFGERFSSMIFSEYLIAKGSDCRFVDSRTLVKTSEDFTRGKVLFDVTNQNISEAFKNPPQISVVPGFIASTLSGISTTLGRNGSDFSASIFGAALNAEKVEIWTDIDGVYTADPRIVSEAFPIPELAIDEAVEMAFFGAEVIHPYTFVPLTDKNIPVYIKSSLNPDAPGTKITSGAKKRNGKAITGIASIGKVSLINIEGSGMIGMPGIAARIFQAIADAEINVIMISQASSEQSICLVCRTVEAENAKGILGERLQDSLSRKIIQKIERTDNLEIVAVVGDSMKGTVGISGKLFSALGAADVNIHAIAQGSSERNISFVIDSEKTKVALNTIHKTFLGE